MKKKSTSKSAFFNLRVLFASVLCLFGVFVALLGFGAFSNLFAQIKGPKQAGAGGRQDAPGTQTPEVVQLVGPVRMNTDLRDLPYIPPAPRIVGAPLKRFPPTGGPPAETSAYPQVQSLLGKIFRAVPNMPPPLLTFDGVDSPHSGCGCEPPDTNGDVGPNHYVETVNESFQVFDKNGNTLAGPTTFNSLFAPLVGTPCSGQNAGDPLVYYDQTADRWLVTDFAFASFGGSPSYQCIAVSQTPDPVAGGWFLYALLVDPTNANDYPKMAVWNNPTPGGAYHYTANLWANFTTFTGVTVMALDRGSMLSGGPANAIQFTIPIAGLGASYSLVPAAFRTGNPPPAGRDEMLLAVDSPATENTTLTQVKGWLFHVDFANPGNSTLGTGANHDPNALMTVNGFVEAWTNATGFTVVPQTGTSNKLDSLGDKIMTPVVYQFRNGTESLWADQTNILNFPNGPTIIRWYQFDVTGGTFPASAAQQQDWSNGGDGLWRFMPSIAVDQNGDTAIGYAVSKGDPNGIHPGIRYAGRLETDPPNDLSQGEAVMTDGTGSQTGSRWGDYSMTTLDTDGMTFWHTNEYYATTTNFNWKTRIGKFNFQGGGISPTPTPTATPASCSWAAGPSMPSVGARMVGVFFPANGKFYAMGGRSSDVGGSEFTNPFEYDPGSNSWTTKSATYPDNHVNNMACGVLTESGIPYIYCVGGSEVATQTATGRVFRYEPITDTISTVPANWPSGDQNFIPGGFSVYNNNMFILGGFDINVAMDDNIWQFDPVALVWTHKNAHLPTQLGYIPQATIGNLIYTGGGSTYDGTLLHDSNISLVYDPVADTIGNIAAIPRATAETRGLNFCDTMYVMGGGREAPNPSNEVDIYDPVANSWSVGTPFSEARRNFPTDTDGTTRIWLSGGYGSDGVTLLDSMEIFTCPVSPCASPSPTPTATATATPTATATASATPTATGSPAPTPRQTPTPRPRPTPAPRP